MSQTSLLELMLRSAAKRQQKKVEGSTSLFLLRTHLGGRHFRALHRNAYLNKWYSRLVEGETI